MTQHCSKVVGNGKGGGGLKSHGPGDVIEVR